MRWFRLAADQGYWNGAEGVLQLLIAYEFGIKPILVRVCGERYLAIKPPTWTSMFSALKSSGDPEATVCAPLVMRRLAPLLHLELAVSELQ
jgi:hypothetical protein